MSSNFSLSRRSLLSGAATAAVASPFLNLTVAHAAEPGGKALRAIHRFNLGAMRVTVIDDARFTFPAPAFAANQPQGTIGPFLDRFGLSPDFASPLGAPRTPLGPPGTPLGTPMDAPMTPRDSYGLKTVIHLQTSSARSSRLLCLTCLLGPIA